MKIACIKCSEGLNQGNDFINFGGQAVIERLFPNATADYFEFFDSCLGGWKKDSLPKTLRPKTLLNAFKWRRLYNSDLNKNSHHSLTSRTMDDLKNNYNFAVIFGGSAGGDDMYENFFKGFNEIGIPFVIIGIGCEGAYNDAEKNALNAIYQLKNCIGVATRDSKSFGFLSDHSKAISGIDLAFFASDYLGFRRATSAKRYATVGIDPWGYLLPDSVKRGLQRASAEFDTIYVLENRVEPTRALIPNYIQIGSARELWYTLANSGLNITTRIHSCVCSFAAGTDFIYLGQHDHGGKKGRNTLFAEIGIELQLNTRYHGAEINGELGVIKDAFLEKLKGTDWIKVG